MLFIFTGDCYSLIDDCFKKKLQGCMDKLEQE